jgi:putative nucleotide binding protein
MTTTESGDADDASESGGGDDSGAQGETDAATVRYAVVLDHLPHGRADDDRPRHRKSPLAYALGERDFRLFELTLSDDADISIGDRVVIGPTEARDAVAGFKEVQYDDISNTANAELEYAIEEIVDANEQRFVDFYNDAQPITLRLHQLNLLPGIGKKLRNNVLDQRKRGPFESFADVEDRVSGLHRPKEILVERIMEELRDDDLKYKTFVGRES